jgi:ferric-dicitrate binding protein FerR (iron transport regulator)
VLGIYLQKLSFDKTSNEFVEITASEGQKIDISLPDGNRIWINSNSSIKYPIDFRDFNKRIYVQGEVYFEFSEENEKPLFVIVNEVVIQSFYGAFNIKTNTTNTGADISVTQGWVTVNNLDVQVSDLIIEEGYVCSFSSELPLFIAENDNANYLAWKTGNLYFEDTPLKIVAQTLSNHYGKNIQVQGRIQYCNFTSDYNNAKLETILNDIEVSVNTKINMKNNEVIIEGDDCYNL